MNQFIRRAKAILNLNNAHHTGIQHPGLFIYIFFNEVSEKAGMIGQILLLEK